MNEMSALTADQVAEYLRQHPEFLQHWPDLIDYLQWPEDPRTTSLIQHQVLRLRQRKERLESQLEQLTAIAGDNERLMQRLHRLTLELMSSSSNTDFLRQLFDLLARDFSAAACTIHLKHADPELEAVAGVHVHAGSCPDWFEQLLDRGAPYCGRLTREKAEFLFADQAATIGSSALVPAPELGLLAIGSEREDHFHPAMGTLFLELLRDTIAFRH